MKIIVEATGARRFINTNFKIYGTAEDLKIIAKTIEQALNQNLAQGWVEVGETLVKDETIFPYDITATEKPTYPFAPKI